MWCGVSFSFRRRRKKTCIGTHSIIFFFFFAHHLAPKTNSRCLLYYPFGRSVSINKYTYVCIRSTFNYWGKRNGNYGGLEFKTIEVIPQNAQLCFWYGPGWWSARGVKRLDVGTVKHPAPLRVLVCSNNQTKKKKKNSEKDTTNVTNDKKQKKKKTKSVTDTFVGSTTARKKRKVAA